MGKIIQLCAVVSVVLLGAGCATNRGIVDVRVPLANNPSAGTAVKIMKVNDLRKFELAPDSPSVPSLKGGKVNDKSITSRAIARKRNIFGKAMGDILLPDGRTVEDLVRETTEKALMERGYVVASKDSPQYQGALPIEIDIHQFWTWVNPVHFDFEAIITARNDRVFISPNERIRGHVSLKVHFGGTRDWTNTINKGIEELGEQIKKNTKKPE